MQKGSARGLPPGGSGPQHARAYSRIAGKWKQGRFPASEKRGRASKTMVLVKFLLQNAAGNFKICVPSRHMVVGVGPDGGGDGDDGGGAGGGCPVPASFASSIPMRTLSASFSSRARRAMSLTASNSSRLTRLRSRSQRSNWFLNMVSNSRLTPCATPAASFIRRATSSKKRLVVWVMGASDAGRKPLHQNGDPPASAQACNPPARGAEPTDYPGAHTKATVARLTSPAPPAASPRKP